MLNVIVFKWDEVIIYLRKSRADSPIESVEEVLAKHEKMLQEKSVEMFGREIPEENIYREVVSGETLAEREEMQKVLSRIENPSIKAVLVVEPQRLSRGDLEDCGRVVNVFKYTNTQVITLQMTYDLNNKMHRKFFEQELMRGNDYLEYTKEILLRGRLASVQKGCYIAPKAPYGYDKVIIDDNPTLKPNDYADVVKLIFELYTEKQYSYGKIAKHLDELGIKPMHSEYWEECTIRVILTNPHYTGIVRFGYRKEEKTFEDGVLTKKKVYMKNSEEVIIAKGLHEAIIPMEVYEKAQVKMHSNPRAKWDAPLRNPFATLIICKSCGRQMIRYTPSKTTERMRCANKTCKTTSVKMEAVTDAIVYALQHEELPELEAKLENNDGLSANIQKKQLEKLNKELAELHKQEERQFELLEKEIYTEEMFLKRHKELTANIENLKSQIYNLKQSTPKEVNYNDKIVKLKDAIAAIKDDSISAGAKNKLLKSIIEKIEFEFMGKQDERIIFKIHVFLRV